MRAAPKSMYVTRRQLAVALDSFAENMGIAMRDLVGKRLDALEEKPFGLRDAGVWRTGQAYAKGEAVTYAGALWVARRDLPDIPGKGADSGWRLAAKSGSRRRNP